MSRERVRRAWVVVAASVAWFAASAGGQVQGAADPADDWRLYRSAVAAADGAPMDGTARLLRAW